MQNKTATGVCTMNKVVEVVLWLIIASLVVLVIMNPKGFVAAMGQFTGLVTGESKILTGAGYSTAKAA
jgi:hypothetical protein